MILYQSLFLFVFIFLKPTHSSVAFEINPGCNLTECTTSGHPALFYGQQDIGDDAIHIFYSSFDELTISIFQIKKGHPPKVNYTALFGRSYANAISFGDIYPINLFSVVIRRLMVYSDRSDTATLNLNDSSLRSYWLNNLKTSFTERNQTITEPNFQLPLTDINGTLTIDIDYPGESTRDTHFPKLRSTPKSFYLSLALQANNLSDSYARFALEYYLIQYGKEGYQFTSTKYIDDQYTPGVFNAWQIKSQSVIYPSSMLWKPIVYQSPEREVGVTTLMKISDLRNNLSLDNTQDQGIFRSLYTVAYVSGFNLSLGFPQDGFFIKTNYSFIQLTAALDALEIDSTQQFILLALIVILTLPTLVALTTCVFICKRRSSQRQYNSGYDPIDDD